MSSITVHNLDEDLERHLRRKASEDGGSLNKTIKDLLRRALGLEKSPAKLRLNEFSDLSDVWTRSDLAAFGRQTRDFARIEPDAGLSPPYQRTLPLPIHGSTVASAHQQVPNR